MAHEMPNKESVSLKKLSGLRHNPVANAAHSRPPRQLKILIVASEAVPFAKTGGLADVAGALPRALAALGHDVRLAMPKYGAIDDAAYNLLPILGEINVHLGGATYVAQIEKTPFPDSNVPVYFVQNEQFFGRTALYQENGLDFPDNALRFAFFSTAVIWLLKGLDWTPDIIQCNDWQTALIPVYLRTNAEMVADGALSTAKILYTIHNLAYQGQFDEADRFAIDIGDDLFHPAGLEFYDKLNFMKGGILFADAISTVSPRYAEEITTVEYGAGLEGVLAARRSNLTGILNGIDYAAWNPATDDLIPAKFTKAALAGKAKCKKTLQRECGLPQLPDVPLIGIISRLDPQKGFDLILESLNELVGENLQIVLLGTGKPDYCHAFEAAAKKNPQKLSANLKFDNGLAHRIEAGSDMFLMPSRYEPCGLNQLYSLKYGTIPIVRATGGLADSILDAGTVELPVTGGTGFAFKDYTSEAMMQAIRRAIAIYSEKPRWHVLMKNAMSRDFSWDASACEYEKLFFKMLM